MSSKVEAVGFADAIARAGGLQGRIMWCDAEANLEYLSTQDGVADVAQRCKDAGINTIVVDVKPLSGYVLYNSKIAPHMSACKKEQYPKGYDLLAVMISEGHKRGLKVHAAVNVFAEGSQAFGSGTAFNHSDWQCVNYETDYWVVAPSGEQYPLAGTDVPVERGRLFAYTKDFAEPLTDATTVRVTLDKDSTVTSVTPPDQASTPPTPTDTQLLIAGGPAGDWLSGHAQIGAKLEIQIKPRFAPVSKSTAEHLAVFVNPANAAVRDYEVSIAREIVHDYAVDGLILDRMRYPNMYADFSDLSRSQFEAVLGKPVERWPEDIYQITAPGADVVRGQYFNQWLEWRSRQIKDFLSDLRTAVKSEKPELKLGVYVGSWYNDYYGVGVNWGSAQYSPKCDWATTSYNTTGYAGLVDYMCTGCYYPYATRADARAAGKDEGGTVEASAQASNTVTMDDTFVYPSLYLLDYQNKPEAFTQALQAALGSGQGIMLFDLVYVRKYDWWPLLKQAFTNPSQAPHDIPGLLDKVHEVRDLIQRNSQTTNKQ